jgi:hypothetical protein
MNKKCNHPHCNVKATTIMVVKNDSGKTYSQDVCSAHAMELLDWGWKIYQTNISA